MHILTSAMTRSETRRLESFLLYTSFRLNPTLNSLNIYLYPLLISQWILPMWVGAMRAALA